MSTTSGNLGGIVKLPKAQLITLFELGTVTYDDVTYTYDKYTIYLCDEGEEWQRPVASTSVSAAGVISYKDASNNVLFSVQLPLYTGGVT